MSKKLSLLSDSSDSEVDFKINKSYADSYNTWRNKEELQKLKDLSKDISESSSSSEEDEPEIEEDFLKTLSLLKSKDPKIYDKNVTFFKDQQEEKKPKVHKPKPVFMKDYERKLVLERNGEFSDEDDQIKSNVITYSEEQEELKKSFKTALQDSGDESDDEDDLLQARKKTKDEEDLEEAEYIRWLKGQEEKVPEETEKEMSFLRKYWNDPKLDDGEKFLKDFILNKKYIVNENDEIPTYDEITGDVEMLKEDEKELEQQAIFEHKYNFRFEEPDEEFIKRYPRTIGDSLRRVNSKRKEKREEYSERKKKEKDQKREELKRLKALKRKEIEEKFMKLKEVTGQDEINLDENDIESDFDPDKHDKKMQELFNDDYYKVEEDNYPKFPFDEELDDENWNSWTRENATNNDNEDDDNSEVETKTVPVCAVEDTKLGVKEEFEKEMIGSTQNKKRTKKKSLFAKIISEPKPLFEPDGKAFEEYLEDYYKLDYEDIIGDMPVRYKYRKVVPNSFGLSVDEILAADDRELNRWCSVKKTSQYRDEEEEFYDVQAFQKRAQNEFTKKKIFQSLYAKPEKSQTENANNKEESNTSKKKRKKKSKNKKESVADSNVSTQSITEDCNTSKIEAENADVKEDCNTSKYQTESAEINEECNTSKKKRKKKSKGEKHSVADSNVSTHLKTVDGKSVEGDTGNKTLVQDSTLQSSMPTKRKRCDTENSISDSERFAKASGSNNVNSEENISESVGKKSRKRKKKKHDALNASLTISNDEQNMKAKFQNAVFKNSEETEFTQTANEAQNVSQDLSSNQCSDLPSPKKRKKKKKKKAKMDESSVQVSNVPFTKSQNVSKKGFSQQKHFKQNFGDKRLQLSDSRLAAYGINPKKFKNHIIYSQN